MTFKTHVVEWLRKNDSSISKAAEHFAINRKSVREWIKRYDTLKLHDTGSEARKRKIGGGPPPMSTELDQRLFEFLEEERSEGRAVSNQRLRLQALQLALGLELEGFKASNGWMH